MSEEKKGFFRRLREGLTKTRNNIVAGIDSIFSGFSSIDDDFYEELEEILIMGDLGVDTTMNIIEDLQARVKEEHIKEPAECRQLLIDIIKKQMAVDETAYEYENRTSVVLVYGKYFRVWYPHYCTATGKETAKHYASFWWGEGIDSDCLTFCDSEFKTIAVLSS